MTASRNKASRAVTAALVGVLSVGAVPMVAVAAESGGATPLIALEEDQVKQSTITVATDESGQSIDDLEDIRFAADGSAHYVVPTAIYNATKGETTYLKDAENLFVFYFKADDNGTATLADGTKVSYVADKNGITKAGTYYVGVRTNTSTSIAGSQCVLKFEIVDTSWDDAYVCDGTDATDTVIEYDGTDQWFSEGDLSLVVDGTVYNGNAGSESTSSLEDFLDDISGAANAWGNLKCFVAGQADADADASPNAAGDYVLRVKVGGVYHYVDFTISPLDISTSAIVLNDSKGNELSLYDTVEAGLPTSVMSVGGVTVDKDGKIGTATIKLQITSSSVAPTDVTPGSYTYVVSAVDDDDNVVGEQEVTVVRYTNDAGFNYNRKLITPSDINEDGCYDLGASAFDPSAVEAVGYDGEKLPVSISYTKGDGTPLGDEMPTAPGTYIAVVSSLKSDYSYGGQLRVKFVVSATRVDVDEIYAFYKGSSVKTDTVTDIYDGTDLAQNVTVSATDEDGEAVPEGQLELVVTDSDGNVVEEAVEAGTYTVTIKAADGSAYDLSSADGTDSFKLVIEPVTVQGDDGDNARLQLVGTMGYADPDNDQYLYTGEAVTPTFEYDLTENVGEWGYDKSVEWVSLPTDTYDVRYQRAVSFEYDEYGNVTGVAEWADVDECVEPGTYRAVLTDAKSDGYVINTDVEFVITDSKVYADVPNDEWYSADVYEAKRLGYMTGYAGGTFFGPMDEISRAHAVMVIWNMAGCPQMQPSGGSSDLVTFDLPYTDVDEGADYAQALLWATNLGIVSGDGSAKETFRPADSVTREEFAKMLYVYEQLQGNTYDVDEDSILSAYADADTVSEWAEGYVAWLVDKGVMGQGETVNGTGDIVRCEVAAMAVRLQPGGKISWGSLL